MLFHEAEPGAQPLHLLPGSGDPLTEGNVLSLEQADPLARLSDFRTALRDPSLARRRGEIVLGLQTAGPPSAQLHLYRGEEALQLLELGLIRPCVG